MSVLLKRLQKSVATLAVLGDFVKALVDSASEVRYLAQLFREYSSQTLEITLDLAILRISKQIALPARFERVDHIFHRLGGALSANEDRILGIDHDHIGEPHHGDGAT